MPIWTPIDFHDRKKAARRAADEDFVGGIGVVELQVPFSRLVPVRRGQLEDGLARHADQNVTRGCAQARAVAQENVAARRFADMAAGIEKERFIGTRGLGLQLGQDKIEVIQTLDLRIEDFS